MLPLVTTLLIALLALAAASLSSTRRDGPHQQDPVLDNLASREFFYVGGEYVNASLGGGLEDQYMQGQIYVERLVPPIVKHRRPLVFIHGLAQTATNWLSTPDNRPGWASYLLAEGYIIYLTDLPERGRSPWLPGSGKISALSTTGSVSLFTAPEVLDPLPFPQAKLHTQWPGTGLPGDAIFDSFYASQVQYQSDSLIATRQTTHAFSTLLDRIAEPIILITHSQAGPFGWQIGDARPNLIAGLVALEPGATPFETWRGPPYAPGYFPDFGKFPYGLTILPVEYDPPLPDNDPGALVRQEHPAPGPEKTPCILQAEPARRLVNLAKIPVLQIVGEASFQAPYSYCVAEYLKQAGVEVEFVNLGEAGVHGNGHMMFLEKNNGEIVERVVLPWLEHVEKKRNETL